MDDSLEVVAEMSARDRRAEKKTEGRRVDGQKMYIPQYQVYIFVGFFASTEVAFPFT